MPSITELAKKVRLHIPPRINPTPPSHTELAFSGGKLPDGTRVVGVFPEEWMRTEYSEQTPDQTKE